MKSQYLATAELLIASVKGKALKPEERREKAIELAALLLNAALNVQGRADKKQQKEISRLVEDPQGKFFTTQLTDQGFRSQNLERAADQLTYILHKFGIPRFLSPLKRGQLLLFKWFAKSFPSLFVPLVQRVIRQRTSRVILPGELDTLTKHLVERKKEGVKINLNHLGEAILGEAEASERLRIYLEDLSRPEVEYVSIKISSIYSQLNLLSRGQTLKILSERLKQLYRLAQASVPPKFVNLDMEEYRDLQLTIDLFRTLLNDPEFFRFSSGIVLQSYLPDSYEKQKELTEWALNRVEQGGAPIKIRLVKGANLAMEQVEASLKGWPQAPFTTKLHVDANFKQMMLYGMDPKHAKAVNLGIGSHNLFDIAYALLLRSENCVENFVGFEMLEGMADPIRKVIQDLTGKMLLYCPVAKQEEFQFAVAYLVRRLDENTAPENFLRHAFNMTPGTDEWKKQVNLFSASCEHIGKIDNTPRRKQNRFLEPLASQSNPSFQNESDTDWSLKSNCEWAQTIVKEWSQCSISSIPLVVGKQTVITEKQGMGQDPSFPEKILYNYSLAEVSHVNEALNHAEAALKGWKKQPIEQRSKLLKDVAQHLRRRRNRLIGAMIADAGKIIYEADVEVSEAIDFAEYYRKNLEDISRMKDVLWEPKGVIVVAPPWNFPCSIPVGCISAALVTGNSVIFKPAPEAVLVGWELTQAFWDAGVEKDLLQFLPCEDEPTGSELIKNPRVKVVMLTGATETAKMFLKMRPNLDLIAETGGKNAIILTNLSDRDLAIKDLIQSAFGHAGQKCSACSLAICESEVYDDSLFLETLKDAASSLVVDSQWNLASRIPPLIHSPQPTLMRGLTELENGETWLLEPKQDPKNPNLWSPGIKLGVNPSSFTYQNELFGPVLALMRAENLKHAIALANGTPYGLTSGLHSLDEREHHYWVKKIAAGNLYINRGITGAIVQRQPFGGCKQSCFGRGAKAGGPNYLMQLMNVEQMGLPEERNAPNEAVIALQEEVEKHSSFRNKIPLWRASVQSYAFSWNQYFQKKHDPSSVLGQDNELFYQPHYQMTFRIQDNDDPFDVLRVIAAAATCGLSLEVSGEHATTNFLCRGTWRKLNPSISFIEESESRMIQRILQGQIKRLRILREPTSEVFLALAKMGCNKNMGPVLANGRIELTHYLREVVISIDYHRYGNLGVKERHY